MCVYSDSEGTLKNFLLDIFMNSIVFIAFDRFPPPLIMTNIIQTAEQLLLYSLLAEYLQYLIKRIVVHR